MDVPRHDPDLALVGLDDPAARCGAAEEGGIGFCKFPDFGNFSSFLQKSLKTSFFLKKKLSFHKITLTRKNFF